MAWVDFTWLKEARIGALHRKGIQKKLREMKIKESN